MPAENVRNVQIAMSGQEHTVGKKMSVQLASTLSIIIAILLSVICIVTFVFGHIQFDRLKSINNNYALSEQTAGQLDEGSRYLTDSVRAAVMTGEQRYIDQYFYEVEVNKRRDHAVQILEETYPDSASLAALDAAMAASEDLMITECYAMKLVEEANRAPESKQPTKLRHIELHSKDAALSKEGKMAAARDCVSNDAYEEARTIIDSNLNKCTSLLSSDAQNEQAHASGVFENTYLRLEICVALFALIMLATGLMLRRLVVKPLHSYKESIDNGETLPLVGASELQSLAKTYNRVYLENEQAQKVVRHQAEHDGLTDLLNRGFFDRVLDAREASGKPTALVLCDVDKFKNVNDTCGHIGGDQVLKHVAALLMSTFRSDDFVCRIGGDEFAVIMVDASSEHKAVIAAKIDAINEQLADVAQEDMPKISISAGIAFADDKRTGGSLFNRADKALYYTKEHGRCGYTFYNEL